MDTEHATATLTPADRLRHLEATATVETETELRHHVEHDHGASVYENDDRTDLVVMHDGLHRRPAMAPAPPAPPAELVLARQEQELARMAAAERAYDVEVPATLRERLAYAKALAGAGIIPKAFRSQRPGDDGTRETTANVFLAMELGGVFGMAPLTALGSVNVVEGKPGLGAEAQLAQALERGHDLEVDSDESDATQGVVHVQRYRNGEPVGKRHRVVYALDDAVAAGLCRIVDGKAYARSSTGKPLPWETSTPDMLVWRAVTRACKRYLPDVTAGLAAYDGEPADQQELRRAASPASSTTAEQAEAPARVRLAPQPDDAVAADLALFTDRTGPWWEHAKADVRRRSKLQLAADRLADALERGDDRVPQPTASDVVDAEVVEDEPGDTAPVPDAPDLDVLVDVGAEAAELERALAEQAPDLQVVADVPADEAQQTEPAQADPVADEPLPAEPEPEAPAADEPAPAADRAEAWAAVEALAASRGKSVTQLMARHIMVTRKNPEDHTADELQAFLDAQAS